MKILLLFSLVIMSTSHAQDLTIERIFSSPSLSGTPMRNVKFSPDGARVTFLQGKEENKDQFDLWQYHIESQSKSLLVDSKVLLPDGEQLSAEEKARRERQRTASFSGIIEYAWSPDNEQILFPLNGNLYVYNLLTKSVKQITNTTDFDTDAKFSPNGSYVSFIRKQNIYVVDLNHDATRQLTTDGQGVIKNGMAEFIAQEEMDRDTGYWWSPDETKIAFIQVDETPVAITQRYEINAESIEIVDQRYPYTGEANVLVKLAILNLSDNKTTWMDIGEETDIYLPRVRWHPDSQRLIYQLMQRNQQHLSHRIATLNGKSTEIFHEVSQTWINLSDDFYFLNNDFALFTAELHNYKSIYRINLNGQELQQLVTGSWVVDEIMGINEDKGIVYFTGSKQSPIEKHLYALALDTLTISKLTKKAGWHEITMDDNAQYYINNWSSREHPEHSTLHNIDGKLLTLLNDNTLKEGHPYYPYLASHQTTEFGTILAADKQRLYYRITKPKNFDANKKYPVFVYTYGGPHVQVVVNAWGRAIEQYMAQQGFVVFALDNRGTARRGVRFESKIYKQLGKYEIEDQVAGVEFLKSLDYVDANKIGIFGWSYGGFMALKAMTKTDVFALGVAVAPVADFALYDTHYTERYMSTPQLNSEGYQATAIFDDVANIKKPLLVIHGMADDNVLFSNSTKLFKAMQDAGIMYDSVIYPGAKHGISGEKPQIHVWKTISQYFIKHLSDAP
ncbi:MAG: DPP IV N-terminal domain-containing protein [Proteobacteria bacterium]|nr:DPP IV N-terminal domain-containing protein [Pseudomonadota bacterium]